MVRNQTYATDFPSNSPKLIWYKDAGEVAIHSDLAHTDRNLSLSVSAPVLSVRAAIPYPIKIVSICFIKVQIFTGAADTILTFLMHTT